jgi:hypothetical protein
MFIPVPILTRNQVFVWFFFPETAGRTLEELAFCESTILETEEKAC